MIETIPDSGPLIHLAELDALDVLQDLSLRITPTVLAEVYKHRPDALSSPYLHLVETPFPEYSAELRSLIQAFPLDQGEAESLALLEAYPQAWFLTDDAAARLAAEHRGYKVHGTIGLLIRGVRQNVRTGEQILTVPNACLQDQLCICARACFKQLFSA